jgi:hypothetical protein
MLHSSRVAIDLIVSVSFSCTGFSEDFAKFVGKGGLLFVAGLVMWLDLLVSRKGARRKVRTGSSYFQHFIFASCAFA